MKLFAYYRNDTDDSVRYDEIYNKLADKVKSCKAEEYYLNSTAELSEGIGEKRGKSCHRVKEEQKHSNDEYSRIDNRRLIDAIIVVIIICFSPSSLFSPL